jgi:hypothetical protein
MLANPPFLAHLSFRLGNQLFCVRVEDVDGNAQGPGTIRGLATAARHANGHACILPMKKKRFCDSWVADLPGWGLLNAATGKPINPVSLVTSEKIVMSPWEVHDVAVQVGRVGRCCQRGPVLRARPTWDPLSAMLTAPAQSLRQSSNTRLKRAAITPCGGKDGVYSRPPWPSPSDAAATRRYGCSDAWAAAFE